MTSSASVRLLLLAVVAAVPSSASADVVAPEIGACSFFSEWSPCSTSNVVGSCQKSSCYHRGSAPMNDAGGWDPTPWPCLVCRAGPGGCSAGPGAAPLGVATAALAGGLGLFGLLRRRGR